MSYRSLASRLVSGSSRSRIFGCPDQRAAERNTLLLASRQRRRLLLKPMRELAASQRFRDALRDLGLSGTTVLDQWVGEILEDGEVRIEREGLEHHRNAAPLDGRFGHVPAPQYGSSSAVGRHEPRDGSQRRGLADRTRAEQHEEAALRDVEAQAVEGANGAIGLRHLREGQRDRSTVLHLRSGLPASALRGPRAQLGPTHSLLARA